VLAALSIRDRVAALMMAHAGIRPGVLAAPGGSDGLTLGDIKDLALGKEAKLERLPFHVVVPARLSG
jgi:hypothetical protein